jgi:hypothetical protein
MNDERTPQTEADHALSAIIFADSVVVRSRVGECRGATMHRMCDTFVVIRDAAHCSDA